MPRSCLLFALLLMSCRKEMVASFDFSKDLGVVVQTQTNSCLDIDNAGLSSGQQVRFVTTSPQQWGIAEIIGKTDTACSTANQNKPGLNHYQLKVLQGSLRKFAPAIGIVGFKGQFLTGEGGITADLAGNGKLDSFRSCTSSEGVHLTVWQGKPLEGVREWHYYYYLGYDVEPTCTDRDTAANTQ